MKHAVFVKNYIHSVELLDRLVTENLYYQNFQTISALYSQNSLIFFLKLYA